MVNTHSTMGLKEELLKKILEVKMDKTTKHAKSYIQKLQQKLDELVKTENEDA